MSAPLWAADFDDAHGRHWRDGEMLYKASQWANADHLYGLSAEYGLKAVMEKLGMATDSQGTPERKYRRHIDEFWSMFLTFATGRGGSKYAALLSGTNPFDDWSVHQRYVHETHFTDRLATNHRKAARRVCNLVAEAKRDGVLP